MMIKKKYAPMQGPERLMWDVCVFAVCYEKHQGLRQHRSFLAFYVNSCAENL